MFSALCEASERRFEEVREEVVGSPVEREEVVGAVRAGAAVGGDTVGDAGGHLPGLVLGRFFYKPSYLWFCCGAGQVYGSWVRMVTLLSANAR